MGSRYESQYRTRLAHLLLDQGRDAEARDELDALRERIGEHAGLEDGGGPGCSRVKGAKSDRRWRLRTGRSTR